MRLVSLETLCFSDSVTGRLASEKGRLLLMAQRWMVVSACGAAVMMLRRKRLCWNEFAVMLAAGLGY